MTLTRRELLHGAARGTVALGAFGLAGPVARAARALKKQPRPGRYEYVFPNGELYAFDIDRGFRQVKHARLPTAQIRGVCACAGTAALYVSHGGHGGPYGNGSMLKYDLLHDRVLWNRDYPFGIDSMAVSADGRSIYMPTGAASDDNRWFVLDGGDGRVVGSIVAGLAPHNTIVGRRGTRLYLGGRDSPYLAVADVASNETLLHVGTLVGGVRPFTVNGAETLCFTTSTGFLGFEVGDLGSGKVLHTVPVRGFGWNEDPQGTPSHGITISPDERTVWVIDTANGYVHVFDVRGLPRRVPRLAGSIRLGPMDGPESNCDYLCDKEGWLSHSRDGRFVFVGDSGDVISTASGKIVARLPPLSGTRKYLQVAFDGHGRVAFAQTSRSSVGYRDDRNFRG